MGWDLTGIGSVADFASSLVNRILPKKMSEAERAQAQIAVQEMLEARENKVIDAQREIVVAEMNQGDAFTKRARPMIVYAGLFFIFLVHVALPIVSWVMLMAKGQDISANMPDLTLPPQFWTAWGGVCGIWIIGRSFEKRGAVDKITALITGKKT